MSTTTMPLPRAIAVLKLPEYEVPLLVTCVRAIVRSMTGNPAFPTPDVLLSTVEAAIE